MLKKHKIILVTGGARSGKSSCAEKLAKAAGERRFYIATAPVCDAEMAERVRRHQQLRAADNWVTIEEETSLEDALESAVSKGAQSILIDCLTLWINNLIYHNSSLSEDEFIQRCHCLTEKIRSLSCTVVLVINEVGLGLVPESSLSRKFRDFSGRCSQIIAAEADEVFFMVAGIQMRIK